MAAAAEAASFACKTFFFKAIHPKTSSINAPTDSLAVNFSSRDVGSGPVVRVQGLGFRVWWFRFAAEGLGEAEDE